MTPTPGWKTSEFVFTVISYILAIVMMSGIICTDHDSPNAALACKIVGGLILVVGHKAYATSRADVKTAAIQNYADNYDPTKSRGG